MYDLLSNEELVVALQKGDELAFNFIFNQHYKLLVAFISINTKNKDQSEDIAQHSFISLWNARKSLHLDVSPKSYLYTIAHNQYIDQYRKSIRERDVIEELRLQNLQSFIEEDNEVVEQNIIRLKAIINELPPRCKEILIMSRQRGLDYNEIANELNISPRTVEEQIRIAFKKIRKVFKESNLLKNTMIYYYLLFSKSNRC